MTKLEHKTKMLKDLYRYKTGKEGLTHNEAIAVIHKHNAASEPMLDPQDIEDLCHMGYYHFDQRTSEIVNGMD